MHDIEPNYLWRDSYIASEDEHSPYFGKIYNEFQFTNKIYNYFIHPQWDYFGSPTLYIKILYVDYEDGFAIFELIGEWNDCISNDIMFLKQNIVDPLSKLGIYKYLLLMDHVLNFHGSDNCYYEEWYEDIADQNGYIFYLNTLPQVIEEKKETQIDYYVHIDNSFQLSNWRTYKPKNLIKKIESFLDVRTQYLP